MIDAEGWKGGETALRFIFLKEGPQRIEGCFLIAGTADHPKGTILKSAGKA
jgi:hypothetical protein